MTEQYFQDENSFIEDIYTRPPAHETPSKSKTDFKPWHKPRKQWVRKYQWLNQIEKLVDRIDCSERPLKYLSLPGKDMIDVRCLHEWCLNKRIFLKFLGYNDPVAKVDPSDYELNLSVSELTQRKFIDGGSQVVMDKFEAISEKKSIAHQRMVETGPFDVVNIDLCNSIVSDFPLSQEMNYYNAIYELICYQKCNRSKPWLLFITTRCNESTVHHKASWKLYECIKKNVEEHEAFQKQYAEEFGSPIEIVSSPASSSKKYEGINYRNLVSLGFGKWLLGLLFQGQPKWKIKMLDSVEYTIRQSCSPDMLSLAFEISMVIEPPQDSVGFIINPTHSHESTDELQLALDLISSVKNIKDIDSIIATTDGLKESLINESAKLMEDAHFDLLKYKEWAVRF